MHILINKPKICLHLLIESTNNSTRTISLSFGFVSNENVEEVPELIKKADTALYMSKENGKNQVTDFRIGPHKVKKKSFYETKKSSLA